MGSAVAEWSKALLWREKINEKYKKISCLRAVVEWSKALLYKVKINEKTNKKISGMTLGPGKLKTVIRRGRISCSNCQRDSNLFPIFLFSSSLLMLGGSRWGGFSFVGVVARLPELRLGVKLLPFTNGSSS